MTAEKLIDCIGMIDEKLISEAVGYVPKRRQRHITAYLSAAACICIAVTAAVLISGRNDDIETIPDGSLTTITEVLEPVQTTYSALSQTAESEPSETADTTKNVPTDTEGSQSVTEKIETETHVTTGEAITVTDNVTESAVIPHWEELNEIERYPELYCGGVMYSLSVNDKFTEDEITFIRNGEITGMDEYTGEIKTKACGFYKVKKMSENYMLAVYTGDGMYTGYMNSGYKTETLGEYLDSTDFIGRHEFITMKSHDMSDDKGSFYIRYDIADIKKFTENFLRSNSDAPFVSERIESHEVIFCTDEKITVLRVYDGGYLHLAGMPADKYFLIGETGYSELTEYIEKSAATEKVYYNMTDGTDIPE